MPDSRRRGAAAKRKARAKAGPSAGTAVSALRQKQARTTELLLASAKLERDSAKLVRYSQTLATATRWMTVGHHMIEVAALVTFIVGVILVLKYLKDLPTNSSGSTLAPSIVVVPPAVTPPLPGNVSGPPVYDNPVLAVSGNRYSFSDFDTDRDGVIEVAEVPAMFRALGVPETDKYVEESMKKADLTKDSMIGPSEFRDLIDAIRGQQPLFQQWQWFLIAFFTSLLVMGFMYYVFTRSIPPPMIGPQLEGYKPTVPWLVANRIPVLIASSLICSIAISAMENMIYGTPLIGKYMVGLSVACLVFYLAWKGFKAFLEYFHAKYIKPTKDSVKKGFDKVTGPLSTIGQGVAKISNMSAGDVASGTVDAVASAAAATGNAALNLAGRAAVAAGIRPETVDAVSDGVRQAPAAASNKVEEAKVGFFSWFVRNHAWVPKSPLDEEEQKKYKAALTLQRRWRSLRKRKAEAEDGDADGFEDALERPAQ